jgi:ABC-type branched-subunit amino acid transport system permease subunit
VTLNFILGYAGIFSLAHASSSIGAYTAAIAAMKFGADFAVATLAGMVVSGVISLALALPRCACAANISLPPRFGLQMLAVTIFAEWKPVTGGIGGLIGIPPARLFGFDFSDPVLFSADDRLPCGDPGRHPRARALELRAQPESDPRRRDGGFRARQERGAAEDAGRDGVVVVRGGRRLAVTS